MKKLVLILLAVSMVSGCLSTVHTVGDGPRGGEVRVHHSWYGAWGFLSLGTFDSRDVVGAADDYRITTRFGGIDVLINLFTGPLGFFRRTTRVEK